MGDKKLLHDGGNVAKIEALMQAGCVLTILELLLLFYSALLAKDA